MTSRINRQRATWPQPSKTEAVINTTQLYRKCVQHSPKTWEWEKWGWVGLVSVHFSLSLWSKTFCFPEVCYYRPSSWVAVRSGACSYKPWGFQGNRWTDWVAFTRGISAESLWSVMSGPSSPNLCWTGLLVEVVVRTSFLAPEYRSDRTQDA